MKNTISIHLKKVTVCACFFLFLISSAFSQSQGGTWTWMSGDNSTPTGVYGTQGIPSAANKPPGLTGAAAWTDLTGKFWLYGGQNYTGTPQVPIQADLWMFDPSTNEWTWVKGPGFVTSAVVPNYGTMGVPSPTNTPGSRNFTATWVDNSGDLWLFGGSCYDSSNNLHDLNDLWKYNIATNQWTWMKGTMNYDDTGSYGTLGVSNPNNNPACRQNGNATWTDNSGNLWMFGGEMWLAGYFQCNSGSSSALNDLWKFDITTNEWTWMHGSLPGTQDYGLRGTAGVPTAMTRPSVRSTSHKWKDAAGNFWMFGGQGSYWFNENTPQNVGNVGCSVLNNEVWKYTVSTNQWTFIGGTSQNDPINAQESAGASCTFAPTKHPAPRMEHGNGISWIDNCGNFWFYGGYYTGLGINLNRLWRYNYNTNQWSWSGNPSGAANFGSIGVSSANNQPYSRSLGVGWTDTNGNFWMGFGYDISDGAGIYKNDVWRFIPDYCSCLNCTIINVNAVASAPTVCPGSSVTLTASGATNYTWSPSTGLSSTTGALVTATPSTTTTYTVIGTTACASDTTTLTITVGSSPVSVNSATICPGSSVTLTASGASTYSWSPAAGLSSTSGSSVTANPSSTTIYTIVGTTGACTDTTTATVTVGSSLNVAVNSATICSGSSTTLTATGATNYSWSPSTGLSATSGSSVIANPSSTTTYTIIGTTGTCTDTTTATVTVGSSLNVTVNSATICAGTSATLTATGATTYSWSPSTGLSSTTGTSVSANPSTSITYTIIGTNGSCSDTTTTTVTVNNPSNANFSFSGPYCQNSANPVPQLVSGASAGVFAASPSGLVFVSTSTGQINLPSSSPGTYTITNTLPASGACPSVSASASVVITVAPNISVNSPTICNGQSTILTATPSVSGGTYSWSPGNQTTQNISVAPSVTTTYTASYAVNGCSTTTTGTVTIVPTPTATINSNNFEIQPGDNTNLIASGGGTYLWSTGETSSSIFVSPTESTVYCVTVQNNGGCVDSSCVEVKVSCSSTLYVPNCFTPNGDLVNELFTVPGDCIKEFHIAIYDRWGAQIFESENMQVSWDGNYMGKPVPDGVYVYVIEAKGFDNTMYRKPGHVTVLR